MCCRSSPSADSTLPRACDCDSHPGADGRTGNRLVVDGVDCVIGEDGQERPANGKWGESIASMTTAEWRAKYEKDGRIDLFVEEEFNAGSRLIGGRDVHLGTAEYGTGTGEGKSVSDAPKHKCTIKNNFTGEVSPQSRVRLRSAAPVTRHRSALVRYLSLLPAKPQGVECGTHDLSPNGS